ncbi:MAG: hypothetical protein AAFZ18_30615 [Myxococcota bacterium]
MSADKPRLAIDAETLKTRPESAARELSRLLDNARYWLAFDLAEFEPLLAFAPSPLREIGVGLLLAYGEDVGGRLAFEDLEHAQTGLRLPPDLAPAWQAALSALRRALEAREQLPHRLAEGYREVRASGGVSAFALRAAGTGAVEVEGHRAGSDVNVAVGQPFTVRASDAKGRPLPLPVPRSELGAPAWALDMGPERRVLLTIPGPYALEVPGPVLATRQLVAS